VKIQKLLLLVFLVGVCLLLLTQATINGADALNRRKSEHARLRILDGGRA